MIIMLQSLIRSSLVQYVPYYVSLLLLLLLLSFNTFHFHRSTLTAQRISCALSLSLYFWLFSSRFVQFDCQYDCCLNLIRSGRTSQGFGNLFRHSWGMSHASYTHTYWWAAPESVHRIVSRPPFECMRHRKISGHPNSGRRRALHPMLANINY